jgi:AraC-like DNA-binding protein
MTDGLSVLLREMRLESVHYRRLELFGPFRLGFEQAHLRGVHIVLSGACELLMRATPARRLGPGDLLMAPRADAHQLCSVGGARVPLRSAMELAQGGQVAQVRAGVGGEAVSILCGAFVFHALDHPALSGLPRVIHVPGVDGQPRAWIRQLVETLKLEAEEGGPGSEVVMARLSDALVARALRQALGSAEDAGWFNALRDPQLAKVLGALHDDLARGWTLEEMARVAGLSRAAFAARFAERVGEPPMRYLQACRMRQAMALLRGSGMNQAQVAQAVGYSSEAALSAAFKRHTGVAPGAYARGRS